MVLFLGIAYNKYYISKVKKKTFSLAQVGMRKISAFTLVEVLIALTILTFALLAIFRGNVFNLRSSKQASDLSIAVFAAESLMKELIGKGYPESGMLEGSFEENYFEGFKWKRTVESLDIPFVEDLKRVTVEVSWEKGESYTLETIVSRY